MKNTESRVCIGILIVTFAAMVVGIILSALKNPDGGGAVAGAAAALCCVGWFLALKNLKRADAGDFSSEGKLSRIFQKLVGDSPWEDTPGDDRIPEGMEAVTVDAEGLLEIENRKRADMGDFSAETPETNETEIPESEWL